MLQRLTIIATLLCVFTTMVAGQNGAITGTVYDEDGFPLLGANVVIQGTTTGSQTDFIEGKYQFQAAPGVYTLVATYIGYSEQIIEDITVATNETTIVDIIFSEDTGVQLDVDVTVTAKALERGEVAVLKLRQNSDKVQDVISSQEIQRLGASNAAAALTKVTGATVVDGKYVYVRGLGDRYSATTLNGLRLPSIDPYRNSAQLDMIPTSLLDNIVASKTFTPDLPGDFTGGSVNVKIKALPERFTWGVSASTAYNPQNNLRNDFLSYDVGSLGGLGYNDGTLDRPGVISDPAIVESRALSRSVSGLVTSNNELADQVERVADEFGNPYQFGPTSSGVDYTLSANVGNQFTLGTIPLGVFATGTISQDYSQFRDGINANYLNPGAASGENILQDRFILAEDRSTQTGIVNGMVGFNLRPSPSNNITFYTLYSHQGSTTVRESQGSHTRKGGAGTEDNFFNAVERKFVEQEVVDYVLSGEHTLTGLKNIKIEWSANYVDGKQETPDYRYTEYTRQGSRFQLEQSSFTLPRRFWRDLNDDTYLGKLDITIPFLQKISRGNSIQVGGLHSVLDRRFLENEYFYDQAGRIGRNGDFFAGDFDVWLRPENLGIVTSETGVDRTGVFVVDNSRPANSYAGNFDISAAYAMATFEATDKLKIVAGARYEQTVANIESDEFKREMEIAESQGAEVPATVIREQTASIDVGKLLPALNVIYKVNETSNIRASFTQTIARPNMRELAPFGAFNGADPLIVGNPGLDLTSIDNYDLRYEFFPKAGEVISASGFYKKFEDPIVSTFIIAGENQQFTWVNSDEAEVYGVELEFRKKLDFIMPALQDFTVSTNFTLMTSEQQISEQECSTSLEVNPDFDCSRQFNGQSNYIINANLSYTNADNGWGGTIAYNYFDDRLASLGEVGTPDIFERGRSVLDVGASKQLGNFRVSLRGRNLINPAFERFSEFGGETYIFNLFERGREVSLGLSYSL